MRAGRPPQRLCVLAFAPRVTEATRGHGLFLACSLASREVSASAHSYRRSAPTRLSICGGLPAVIDGARTGPGA